jgi:alginate O-acetyltransferase complex protein AlgI
MFLGGRWHGAAWTFVIWGLYHGMLLAVHAACRARGWVPSSRALSVAITTLAVMVGWVFFRSSSLPAAVRLLGTMAGLNPGAGGNLSLIGSGSTWAVLVLGILIAWRLPDTWNLEVPRSRPGAVALALLLMACVFRFATPSPFLYFQF